MDKNICLYGIYTFEEKYNPIKTKLVLLKILRSGYILSRRLQGLEYTYGFNGMDYISLCDLQKCINNWESIKDYNSYSAYIIKSLSFAFPKDKLDIMEPTIIDKVTKSTYKNMTNLGMSEVRYSDLLDEVQVKDKIPISLASGITIPIKRMQKRYCSDERNATIIIKELKKLKMLLMAYNYDFPIYDISTMKLLTDEDSILKVLTKEKR